MRKKNIKVADKIKIVNHAKNGESLHSLERATGYQRNQIRRWLKNEEILLQRENESSRVKGAGRKIMFPVIEKKMIE